MKSLRHFPFTILCVVLIFVLSFFTPPHTPLDNVSFIDKWTHLAMYGGTVAVFWFEYIRATRKCDFILSGLWLVMIALVIPIVLGGVIELLQAYCTGGRRSGEWLDWAADSLGALVAYVFGFILNQRFCKTKNN